MEILQQNVDILDSLNPQQLQGIPFHNSQSPERRQINGQKVNNRLIGTYKIEKTLGQGTFGKVKQGIHIYTNQKVAIKILEKKKIKDVNDVERVTREIHILKIVRHPHIIQLYEIIETQSKLYLIMEHCSNGELFDYITSRNRLKEEEACRLFQQLIAGIEHLGELGIAHRDVKPENLLLDDFKNLKIVDFGLSNTFKAGEKLQTACGSPCYAAPELIRGKEYIGQKADIWSAGVVLYTEVCGYLPFEDQNTQSLYQKILKADFKLPNFLSKEVKDLILHILVPDPDLRFGIKQIKQHKWFSIYKPPKEISKGIRVGIDNQKIYPSLLKEMTNQVKTVSQSQIEKTLNTITTIVGIHSNLGNQFKLNNQLIKLLAVKVVQFERSWAHSIENLKLAGLYYWRYYFIASQERDNLSLIKPLQNHQIIPSHQTQVISLQGCDKIVPPIIKSSQFQILYRMSPRSLDKSSAQSEKYTKQCIEANRHNAATAHYYLLLKQKLVDGDKLEEDIENIQNESTNQVNAVDDFVITASSQLRLLYLVPPRTTKYAQNHQLRKIAEGLGDLKIMKLQNSRENSIDQQILLQNQNTFAQLTQNSATKTPQQRLKNLQIKPPTLQDPDLPTVNYGYDDYGQQLKSSQNGSNNPISNNTTVKNNLSVLRHRDLNRSLDQEQMMGQQQIQLMAPVILNESQTIQQIVNRTLTQQSLIDHYTTIALNPMTTSNTVNNGNRIRIKTKFANSKMTPSSMNKSLNLTSTNHNVIQTNLNNSNFMPNNIPSSNNLRFIKTQTKRINRLNNNMSVNNYSNRMNFDSKILNSTTNRQNINQSFDRQSKNININNYFRVESSSNQFPREPNITGVINNKMSLNTLNSTSAIKSKQNSTTHRRKTSFSQYRLFDSINLQNDSGMGGVNTLNPNNTTFLNQAESTIFNSISHPPSNAQQHQQLITNQNNTINIYDNSINIGATQITQPPALKADILKNLNAYNNQQMMPRNILNQTTDLFGSNHQRKFASNQMNMFSNALNNQTPISLAPVINLVNFLAPSANLNSQLYNRKTPSINVNSKYASYNLQNEMFQSTTRSKQNTSKAKKTENQPGQQFVNFQQYNEYLKNMGSSMPGTTRSQSYSKRQKNKRMQQKQGALIGTTLNGLDIGQTLGMYFPQQQLPIDQSNQISNYQTQRIQQQATIPIQNMKRGNFQ